MLVPVILSGGSGTRLWPVSRDSFPKQFVPLLGTLSTFQATLKRVDDPSLFGRPLIVTNEKFRFLAEEQAEAVGVAVDILMVTIMNFMQMVRPISIWNLMNHFSLTIKVIGWKI